MKSLSKMHHGNKISVSYTREKLSVAYIEDKISAVGGITSDSCIYIHRCLSKV
jgi:hypothetical protein